MYALDHGVLLRPLGNILYCMPPYCITNEALVAVYAVIEGVLEEFYIDK
jgi:adenosylmethionine-8-amino-7-oxononanoate aminotransferase